MPGRSLDFLSGRSVYEEERRDHVMSGRSSCISKDHYRKPSGGRNSSHTSRGDDRRPTETPWDHNSDSTWRIKDIDDSPPQAYSEAVQMPLPYPTPNPNSRSPQAPALQPRSTPPRLPLPVIIPQNPRDGGFCHAYAPALGACNVSEAAFFYFLDDFDRSAQASPYFSAVNIASIGSLQREHSTSMLVTLAKQCVNTFLDRVNAEYFQPRGLFALIATWRPDINKTHESVNIEDPLLSSSKRSLPFPQSATLTFPLGDPTENMLLNSDILMQNGMYNNISSPASPAYGRGAGIPRLAGGNPQSYVEPYGYCGMVMNNPGYSMGMDQGCGMGMGSGGIGMSGLDEGGMSMGRYPRHHGTGNGLGGVMGGPLGLVTNMMENSVMDKSQPSHAYQGGPNVGHDRRFMAGDQSAAVKDSEAKVFKKDAIYLIILNFPSDDELARFGSAF